MTTPNNESSEPSASTEFEFLIKLLVLGDLSVGKTTFLHQYTDGKFSSKYNATVGLDFIVKNIDFKPKTPPDAKPHKVCLQLWDTAGQERYSSLTTTLFRDIMGFILMFDLTCEKSFLNVRNWLSQLRQHASDDPDIILVGNKSDLETQRAVPATHAKQLAEKFSLTYIETSARTAQNVNESIELLLEKVMTTMQKTVDISVSGTVNVSPSPKKEEKKCAC